MDLRNKEMLLWPTSVTCDRAAAFLRGSSHLDSTLVKLDKLEEGVFSCQAKLQSGTVRAVLDSGSNSSAIRLGCLASLGALQLRKPTATSGLGIASPADSLTISVASLAIGALQIRPPSDCSVVDWTFHADALLGTDVLAHTRVIFDFRRRQVWLQSAERARPADVEGAGSILFGGTWLQIAVGSQIYFSDGWPLQEVVLGPQIDPVPQASKGEWFVYTLRKSHAKTGEKLVGQMNSSYGEQLLYDGSSVIVGKDSGSPVAISLSKGYEQKQELGLGGSLIIHIKRATDQQRMSRPSKPLPG